MNQMDYTALHRKINSGIMQKIFLTVYVWKATQNCIQLTLINTNSVKE